MKKFILAAAAVGFFATQSFAQPEIRFAPEVGATFGTMTQKIDNVGRQHTYQAGFRFGGVFSFQWGDHFVLQPGAYLGLNSGSETLLKSSYALGSGMPASLTDRRRYHVSALQVPVYALYRGGDDFAGHFFIGGGPYMGLALGGRIQRDYSNTLNGQSNVVRQDRTLNIGYTDNDDIGRFDLGLQATVGFELPIGLFFRAYYGYGILNSSPIQNDANQFHFSGGGLSIGYFFHVKSAPLRP